jgi:hypothetical protein
MPRKSERREIAERLAKLVDELKLDQVYAGGYEPPNREKGRNYYSILLCRSEVLDGGILIYGPTFIKVHYQTAIRTLPQSESTTLRNVEQVEAFLRERFGTKEHTL